MPNSSCARIGGIIKGTLFENHHYQQVVGAGDTGNVDGAFIDAFADVVVPNIDVFAASVMGGVVREGHGADVVAEKSGGIGGGQAKFTEEKTEPDRFPAGLTNGDVFGVCCGAGDGFLLA